MKRKSKSAKRSDRREKRTYFVVIIDGEPCGCVERKGVIDMVNASLDCQEKDDICEIHIRQVRLTKKQYDELPEL